MTPADPLVSVIVPAFNGERFIGEALRSVFGQSYRPLEVVVVDDGSTDRTAEIARTFSEAKYVYQENQGVAAARNAGLANSSGELVAFLDADDLWPSDKLRQQVDYHRQNPGIECSFASLQNFVEEGVEPPRWLRDGMQSGAIDYSPCTLLAKRSLFDRVGPFNLAYRIGEDTEWFVRAIEAGMKTGILPGVVVRRRIHGANLSYDSVASRSALLLKILKSSIDRKRATSTHRAS